MSDNNKSKMQSLVWIDLEMSGLDPDRERILEIAVVLTDTNLQVLAQSPNIVIAQDKSLLDNMDEWNSTQHRKTGLYDQVLKSDINEATAETQVLELLRTHAKANHSPMCGSSIHQDRRFLRRYMPTLHEFFHYRNLDVSTVRSLVKYWQPALLDHYQAPASQHRAQSDVYACIAELDFYRHNFLKNALNS